MPRRRGGRHSALFGAVKRAWHHARRRLRALFRDLVRRLRRLRRLCLGRDVRIGLGRRGETRARRWLEHRGYRTLARNLRVAGVEVDLLMLDPDGCTIVIVEVKTRRRFEPERTAPSERQRRRLRRAAGALRRRWPGRPLRGDVLVVVESRRRRCLHWPGALLSSLRC